MSPTEEMTEYTLTVTEVAKVLNVQPMTVRRWIQDGRLPARRLPGTKPYKVRPADVDALIEGSPVVAAPRATEESDTNNTMDGNDLVQALLAGEDADQ